jgi:hypothetical protein
MSLLSSGCKDEADKKRVELAACFMIILFFGSSGNFGNVGNNNSKSNVSYPPEESENIRAIIVTNLSSRFLPKIFVSLISK